MPWKKSDKFRNYRNETRVDDPSKWNHMNDIPINFKPISAIWDPIRNDGEPTAVKGRRYFLFGIFENGHVTPKVAAPNPPFINDDGAFSGILIEARKEEEQEETNDHG